MSIGRWTGQRPTSIAFSSDSGNVATGLTWSAWGQETALAHGVRQEESCVPSCATGARTPYPVTIRLTKPVDGQFTVLTERTADGSNAGRGTVLTWTAPFVTFSAS